MKRDTRMEQTIQIMMTEGIPRKHAMVKAGYSQQYADAYCSTDSFRDLLDEYLPDKMLLTLNLQLLTNADIRTYKLDDSLSDEEITSIFQKVGVTPLKIVQQVDLETGKGVKVVLVRKVNAMVVDRALDRAYKLKDLYAAQKIEVVDSRLQNLSVDELERRIAESEQGKLDLINRYNNYAKAPKQEGVEAPTKATRRRAAKGTRSTNNTTRTTK